MSRSVFESVPTRYRNLALFVLLGALFGGSFVAIKTGLGGLPPVFFGGLRADVAAVALFGYVALTRSREEWLPRTRGDVLGIAVAGLFLVAVNNALLFAGQAVTTPAAASVMYGLNPVLAPVFAWWLLDQRLDATSAAGVLLALLGVVVIVRPSPGSLAGGGLGQAFVLGAAAAVALGSVGLRWAGPSMENVPLTGWAMALGAVVLHAGSLVVGESPPALAALDPAVVLAVLSLGLPSTALAFTIYFGLIGRIGPVRTNFVSYVVPVFAALTGWLVLGSTVTAWTVLGFGVVVAGFAVVEREVVREELRRLTAADLDVPSPGSLDGSGIVDRSCTDGPRERPVDDGANGADNAAGDGAAGDGANGAAGDGANDEDVSDGVIPARGPSGGRRPACDD